MNCEEARTALCAHLAARPAPVAPAPAAMVEHVAGCLACLTNLAEMESAATGAPSFLEAELFEGRACDLVRQGVVDLAQAAVEERFSAEVSPLVWGHLARCADCRVEIAELSALLRETSAGRYGAPPDATAFLEGARDASQRPSGAPAIELKAPRLPPRPPC